MNQLSPDRLASDGHGPLPQRLKRSLARFAPGTPMYWLCSLLALVLVGAFFSRQFNDFDFYYGTMRDYESTLYNRYVTLELLRQNYTSFEANYKRTKEQLDQSRYGDRTLDVQDLAALGQTIDAIEELEFRMASLNPFFNLFSKEIDRVHANIVLLRAALAENLDIQMEWDRYRAMRALQAQPK